LSQSDFERFIGIDWSGGEAESQAGIRVAQIGRRAKRLDLIPAPNGRNWSRGDVLKFLESLTECRTLVGLDFAFSVPWHYGEEGVPGCLGELKGVRDLWAFIDRFCKDASHFYGGPVWLSDESPFRPFIKFWSHTRKYERAAVGACLLRKTEIAAVDNGLRPISVYRMAGPQVGAASFAGMRVLHALASTPRSDIAVWPFDKIENATVVIAEIYPALFYGKVDRRRPTKSQVKTGDYRKIVSDVLQFYGSSYKLDFPESIDAMDALVSAAALCSLSQESDSLFMPGDADISTKEGWIFGVPPRGAL
jgi:hypothetical protein